MTITLVGGLKSLRSKQFNYDFDLETGVLDTWGKTIDEDPDICEAGPLIADVEITTRCGGVNGKPCAYCYKDNREIGDNMSFGTFKKVIEQIDYNGQLTQVALGLGARGEENPDIWKMCEWLRNRHIIPNGTVAQPTDRACEKIGEYFGGVAVSYHGDFEVLLDSVEKLVNASRRHATLKQVNIHYVLCEETYNDLIKLFALALTDDRLEGLNAIVLLALKKCGRAKTGPFTRLSFQKFKTAIGTALQNGIGLGFDSCSANSFIRAARELYPPERAEEFVKLAEPCEASLMSAYVGVDATYHPCSFCQGSARYSWEGWKMLGPVSFKKLWEGYSETMNSFRNNLLDKRRSCPVYDVDMGD